MLDPDRRHLVAYVAAAAVLVVIAVRLLGATGRAAPVPSVTSAAPVRQAYGRRAERPRTPRSSLIWVDVAGAVRRPGLYSLPAGARAAAALDRAGGPLARAETTAVNLAAKLADGQQIVVPMRGRGGTAIVTGAAVGGSGAGAAGSSGAGSAAPAGGAGALAGGGRISLSAASQAQLEELDGIGPALAARIIQYREAHGGFHSIDQLQEVSGIGAKRFAALRGSIAP